MPASLINPTVQTIYWDRSGSVAEVTPIKVTVRDPDVTSVDFSIERISGTTDWLKSTNTSGNLPLGGGNINLEIFNTNDLYPGNWQSSVNINIYDDIGLVRTLTATINFNISGNPPIAITTDQPNYDVVYIRDTNTFSGETTVEILNNTDGANLEFSSIGTLLKESVVVSDFTLEQDPAFPFSTNSELPPVGIKVVNCRLKKEGVFVSYFTVTFAVIESEEIITDPEFLEFKLRKGYNETQEKSLQIINPLNKAFTIIGPDWLNFNTTVGSTTTTLIATTENSETIPVGNYSGNIEIAYDGKTLSVPVTLLVVEFISIPEGNFCLDNIILTATRQNEDARILRISMTVDFKTQEKESQTQTVYDIMYQNGIAKTDIGQKVHQMFPRNRKSLFLNPKTKPFNNVLVYQPASIGLKVEELDINYTIKKSVVLPAFFLYPGKKPKMYPLFTNHSLRSRANGCTYIFSYKADEINAEDITGVPVDSNPFLPKEIHTVKIEESDALITWTDPKIITGVKYFKLKKNQNIQVEWQNQNFAPEWFTFSGEFQKGKDKTHIYQDNSFTLNNEKFEVRNSRSLKANTGFILKLEADMIDELIDSKLCFLKIDGKTYQAFAVTGKLIEEDSALELYQYEVEFIIVNEV